MFGEEDLEAILPETEPASCSGDSQSMLQHTTLKLKCGIVNLSVVFKLAEIKILHIN